MNSINLNHYRKGIHDTNESLNVPLPEMRGHTKNARSYVQIRLTR